MNFFASKIFLVILGSIIEIAVIVEAEPQLKFVSIVFRHGDRAPDRADDGEFATDPYKGYEFPPMGPGGLTNTGKKREFVLGEKIRDLYGEFLGDIYYPQSVNARSTDFYRTKMSLQLVMASLFRPSKAQQWNPELDWQPIVADFVPRFLDTLMIPSDCPLYVAELDRVNKLPEVRAKLNKFSGFLRNLTEWTGQPMTTPSNMWDLYNILIAESSMNLTLPEWTRDIFPDGRLLDGTVLKYDIDSYNTVLRRLNGGMLLKNITESMQSVCQGRMEKNRKLNLYSGHEFNIVSFLKTLGLYKPHVPEYSSAVFVELLGDSKRHYVQIRYYLGIPPKSEILQLPGCDKLCPFEKFLMLMKDVLPSEEEMFCPKKPRIIKKLIHEKFSRV